MGIVRLGGTHASVFTGCGCSGPELAAVRLVTVLIRTGISNWKNRRQAAINMETVVRRSSGWPTRRTGDKSHISVQAPAAARDAMAKLLVG